MQEEEDDRLKSSFYDELFALNLDKLSWYPMQVKSVQAAAARAAAEQAAPNTETPGAAEADQEEAQAPTCVRYAGKARASIPEDPKGRSLFVSGTSNFGVH